MALRTHQLITKQEAQLAFTRGTRGTGNKSQIWQSLDRIANRDMKKKEKRKKEKEIEPKR